MPQMAVMLSFAGTDFTDALQLLIEILLCQIRSSFQSFIIYHPAFDGVVLGIACDLNVQTDMESKKTSRN